MKHDYLNEDNFAEAYLENLKRKVLRETEINTILKNAIRRYKLPKYQLSGKIFCFKFLFQKYL